jgi:putative SOS response-associated peptidase YedK
VASVLGDDLHADDARRVHRCLVPASHFYEFTRKKIAEIKWKSTKAGEDWPRFAGLWNGVLRQLPHKAPIEYLALEKSYHVATIDFDREEINHRAVAFAAAVIG